MRKTIVLGVKWSVEVWDVRQTLEGLQIPYDYFDVEVDEDAYQRVKNVCGGEMVVPTVILPNGRILVAPTQTEIIAHFDSRYPEDSRDTQPMLIVTDFFDDDVMQRM